jgi:Tfp pilus assembly protein PilE
MMVVVALVAVLAGLAAPAFTKLIQMKRLRGVSSQLVTDMQYGRSEAVARRDFLRVSFRSDGSTTCYTLYTAPDNTTRCNCLLGVGAACGGAMVEVRTAQVPKSQGIYVEPPAGWSQAFAFDWRTGGIVTIPTDNVSRPMTEFRVESYIDASHKLMTRLNTAGRPLVCTPAGSTMDETGCL